MATIESNGKIVSAVGRLLFLERRPPVGLVRTSKDVVAVLPFKSIHCRPDDSVPCRVGLLVLQMSLDCGW